MSNQLSTGHGGGVTLEKRAGNTAGIQVVLKKLFFFSLAFSLFILIDRVAITLADLWLQGSFKSS
jgi:hypothetical protein